MEMTSVAEERGASPEQLAIIEDGEISFDEYQVAVTRTVECLRSAGIDVIGTGVSSPRGFPEISYSYSTGSPGRTEAETDAIAQECIMSNSLFVESLYRESPVAQEARELYFEPYRDSVVACLRDNGVEVDDDVARVVAERLIGELMMETGVSCLSGYSPGG